MKSLNVLQLTPTDGRKSFYGKALVFFEDGKAFLKSYNTIVCCCNINGTEFKRLWPGYSATTMRHINAFGEYFGCFGGGKANWDALEVAEV